jgi:nitrile hydratase subunit beta
VSFERGQRVRVSTRPHVGHHRTPGYVKGKTGRVERVHDSYANPETRAYGNDGQPAQALYLVGFDQRELWPAYRGARRDRLLVDVFEHWLEEA